ncbi:MAG: CpaF family protein [Tepidanaerobacteraceae bacterium]|nr:CpaF family protein [Tepidanaerobacteraceae bacterium]
MSLLKKLEISKKLAENVKAEKEKGLLVNISRDPYSDIKIKLHKKIIDELKDLKSPEKEDKDFIRKHIQQLVNSYIESDASHIPRLDRMKISDEVFDEVVGYGPITPLLNDPEISEIMVNGPNQVYIERNGRLELCNVFFRDNDHVMNIIDRIVSPIGRRIDESMPMVDARLPDGSRVNAIIPPLSLTGPVITIRKFAADPLMIEDLIEFGTLTPEMAQFIEACVKAKLNIVVSGGTGSGKTTTLNVLSSFIPHSERIVTIEDAAELQLRQPHIVTLESRPPNIEGTGAINIRDLVRNALRMRPDRIIVGEVRSGEALDMLQAMNTGHDGSLTTGHANSPRDMLSRLETMVLMAGMDLPIRAIREQISSAIDLIIHQSRLRDGSRRITYITEVQGMEGDVIVLQDLFNFSQTGVDQDGTVSGEFKPSGIRPKFIERLEISGYRLPTEVFTKNLY